MTTKEFKKEISPHSQSKRIHALFEQQLRKWGIGYLTEYKFHKKRKWKFDFVILQKGCEGELKPEFCVAVEVEGGYFIKGGHSRGAAQLRDNEKFNEAALLGWRICKFTPQQIESGEAITFVKRLFE